jgi:hypothetical protein
MLSWGGSTMIGGCVGVASGAGEADSVGPGDAGDSVGGTGAGATDPPGAGVTTLPGGLTGPDDGGGTGGFTCAGAASARAHTNARLENGAMTRRKRLLMLGRWDYAIFCSAGSRETADARSVL